MARRFFDPQPFTQDRPSTLGEDASHHISRVLRMRAGERLTVFNGDGGEWQASIIDAGKRTVTVMPEAFDPDDRVPALRVTVALPVIKGERMDYALQKATEMGAHAFQLLETEHSDVRLSGDRLARKLRHWQQVVISACEQCGMNRVPSLTPPKPFAYWLGEEHPSLRLLGHPGLASLPQDALSGQHDCCLVTGPEGGFSDAELDAADSAGFCGFTLGERTLRAETAPVALLAALHSLA